MRQLIEAARQKPLSLKLVNDTENPSSSLTLVFGGMVVNRETLQSPAWMDACQHLSPDLLRFVVEEEGGSCCVSLTLTGPLREERALFFEIEDRLFAIPLAAVEGVEMLRAESDDMKVIQRRGREWTLVAAPAAGSRLPVLYILGAGAARALVVSRVLGEEPCLPTPLPAEFRHPCLLGQAACPSTDARCALFVDPDSDLSLLTTASGKPLGCRASRGRLLVADDFGAARLMLETVLGFAGYRVTSVTDGKEALKALRDSEEKFDAIISDVDMPEMNGLELCRSVKSDPSFAKLPFLVVSMHDSPDERRLGSEAGVDVYLGKERFESTRLLASLAEIFPK